MENGNIENSYGVLMRSNEASLPWHWCTSFQAHTYCPYNNPLGINRNYFMACNPWHGIFGVEIRASYAYSMYHPQHGNHSMEIRAWSLTAGLSTAWKSRHRFFKAWKSPHGCPRHFLSTAQLHLALQEPLLIPIFEPIVA